MNKIGDKLETVIRMLDTKICSGETTVNVYLMRATLRWIKNELSNEEAQKIPDGAHTSTGLHEDDEASDQRSI